MSERFIRKSVAASHLGISERCLTGLMRAGKVPYRKLTRKLVLFRLSEIERAMDLVKYGG